MTATTAVRTTDIIPPDIYRGYVVEHTGVAMRAWRKRMVWTQQDLADRADKSQSLISGYERTGEGLSMAAEADIAAAFGIEVWQLRMMPDEAMDLAAQKEVVRERGAKDEEVVDEFMALTPEERANLMGAFKLIKRRD